MASESRSPAALHDILHCIISYLDPDPYGRQLQFGGDFYSPGFSSISNSPQSLPGDEVLNHLLCHVGIAKEVPRENGWSGPRLELRGTLNTHESGWKRLQDYAAFVRTIIVDPSRVTHWSRSSSSTLLHDTFWCQIASVLGDAPILPRLTSIHFVSIGSNCSIDVGALRLLNPCIQELTIEFYSILVGHETRLKAAFASCFSSTPNLQRLSLRLACPLLDLEALPQSHPRLRHLTVVAPVNPQCLTSIASLPDLESLSICLSEPVNTPVQFKRLRSLSISRFGLDKAATLIASMDAPGLRMLSVASLHRDSLSLGPALFQCLHPLSTRFPSLTAFDWRCWIEEWKWGYPGPRDPGATLAELIEPLLSLRTLRDMSLDFQGPIVSYSSADFCRMAEAWPDLETLALQLEHAHDSEPGPSRSDAPVGGSGPVQYADFESFASFARHCPRLHTLRIPRVRIDSIADTPCLPSESGSPTGHQLRHLQVHEILCSESPGWDGESRTRRNGVFLEMMKPVFPFAAAHLPVVVAAVVS